MIAIELNNVIKQYKLKDGSILALNNITYCFEYGKMYAIMGHSGSGKSTLIQCMGTLDKVTSGKLLINNKEINKMSIN